jgi:hypothetical protein
MLMKHRHLFSLLALVALSCSPAFAQTLIPTVGSGPVAGMNVPTTAGDGSTVQRPALVVHTVDASGVTVSSSTSNINAATALEDAASADGFRGVPILCVRQSAFANSSGTDGDFEPCKINSGMLWTQLRGWNGTATTSATNPLPVAPINSDGTSSSWGSVTNDTLGGTGGNSAQYVNSFTRMYAGSSVYARWTQIDALANNTGTGVGSVAIPPTSAATGAITPTSSGGTASSSSLVVCSSACNLYRVSVTNQAVAGFLMVINATSLPADGATGSTLLKCIAVPAATTATMDWRPTPIRMGTGAVLAFSIGANCGTLTASATAWFSGEKQ